jgi:hypothetical protein
LQSAGTVFLYLLQKIEMKKQVKPFNHLKTKHTMPVKNLTKKSSSYVYTEADLGEGLLHAGVSQLYWLGKQVNKKIKAMAASSKLIQHNNGQGNYCY